MNLDEEECAICGVSLGDKYTHTLKCNHKFHYECLLKTFTSTNNKYDKKKRCPYCKTKCDHLPLINGIIKPIQYIHYTTYDELNNLEIVNKPCKYVKKKSKRKGEECGKKCKIGYDYCSSHIKFDK